MLIYSIGRLWIELLRVDPSHEWGGIRLNVYVAAVAILASAAFFVWWQRSWIRGPSTSAAQGRDDDRPEGAVAQGPFRAPAV